MALVGLNTVDIWNPGTDLAPYANYSALLRAQNPDFKLFTSEPVWGGHFINDGFTVFLSS